MGLKSNITNKFDELGIPYEVVFHQAVESSGQALLVQRMMGVTVLKTSILVDNNKRYYMIVLSYNRILNEEILRRGLKVETLTPISEDDSWQLLNAMPGSENPLDLIFDSGEVFTLLIDNKLKDTHKVAMCPCENHCSLKFDFQDLIKKYLPAIGAKVLFIK